jgi:hypothetical protein
MRAFAIGERHCCFQRTAAREFQVGAGPYAENARQLAGFCRVNTIQDAVCDVAAHEDGVRLTLTVDAIRMLGVPNQGYDTGETDSLPFGNAGQNLPRRSGYAGSTGSATSKRAVPSHEAIGRCHYPKGERWIFGALFASGAAHGTTDGARERGNGRGQTRHILFDDGIGKARHEVVDGGVGADAEFERHQPPI